MARLQIIRKDPDAKLDYGFDWSDWLASGEILSVSVWVVASGLTEVSTHRADTSTLIWLSGGTVGKTYRVSNMVTTSDDRIDERSFEVIIEER